VVIEKVFEILGMNQLLESNGISKNSVKIELFLIISTNKKKIYQLYIFLKIF
jgi:hypothetical protein